MKLQAIPPSIGLAPVILPAVLLLAACGDGTKTAGPAAPATNPPPTAAAPAGASVTEQLENATPAQVNQLIGQTLSYLPANQIQEFEQALYPALDKDPSLVTDGMKMLQDAANVKANPNDQNARNSFLQEEFAYEARLRTAMTAIDPNLGNVFSIIDLNLKM
jgi:hypothetical protein